jgi:hypothetical protein
MFYTPGGLRIRIPVQEAFSLIARIHPNRKGIDILRTTDGLDKFPSFFTDIVVLSLLWYQINLWGLVAGAVLSTIVFTLMVVFGVFTGVSSLVWRLHKVLPDVIRWAVVYGLAYLIQGVDGMKITLFALLAGYVTEVLLDAFITMAFKMTISELEFLQAFQFHAKKFGITYLEQPTSEEIEEGKWLVPLTEYASAVPAGIPQDIQHTIANAVNQNIV